MKCVVRSAAGFYATKAGRPAWVDKLEDAKVFSNVKMATTVVRMIRDARIVAQVVKLGR